MLPHRFRCGIDYVLAFIIFLPPLFVLALTALYI